MDTIEAATQDGGAVLIEVQSGYGSEETSADGRLARHASHALGRARETILRISQDMASAIDALPRDERPRDFAVEFGISFSAEGAAMVAKASAQATLKVTMVYGPSVAA
ncbi:CU044_2847 family protein [Streptomyces sp. NPDC042319]|uniref:CU044_2847 family protein n=1 Tax=Streptomyces sp. NPDC042319 TaxID=3154332 RepID=UPI0033FA8763